MSAIANAALERLRAGELASGVGLRQARTVDIGKIMRTCGYDWLFVDMEHGSLDVDTAVQICVAARDAGITPIVRVPGFQHFHATRVLDGGAQGIVVPHVDTPEVAAEMVSNCRYPPVGHRSVVGALPQVDFEPRPLGEATRQIDASTLLVVMIETPAAVANADAIAAVEGVDALLVGTNDLCMEMGIPGRVDARGRRGAAARRGCLPRPRKVSRSRRCLRAFADGPLHRDGHALDSERQRSVVHDVGSEGARVDASRNSDRMTGR